MLAKTYGPKFSSYPCYVQPKLNGVRALYQAGVFQSRDEKLWRPNVLEHLSESLYAIRDVLGSTILDGELYHHGWRLQRINGAIAVNRLEPTEDTSKVEYHIFDCIRSDANTNPLPFLDRFRHLADAIVLASLPHIKVVTTARAGSSWEIETLMSYYCENGYEGIMLRPDGPYEFGHRFSTSANKMVEHRSPFLWKHKHWEDGEWECIGITQGQGKASIGVGTLIMRNYKNTSADFEVGTGFTDEERVEFFRHPPVGKSIRIRFNSLTSDGIPTPASFIAVMNP